MSRYTPCLLALVGLPLSGCFNSTEHLYDVTLDVKVSGQSDGTILYATVYSASTGEGELAHPLGFIEEFEGESEAIFTLNFLYPLDDGEGLVLYVWGDVDGDGLLCGLEGAQERGGIVEVPDFPTHTASVEVQLNGLCSGPEALYP